MSSSSSTNALVQRIMSEAEHCRQKGWTVQMFPDNCGHWTLTMPVDDSSPTCPYAGKTFKLDINIMWDFPTSPPKVTFTSQIFHPHLYANCNITGCAPTLRWHNQLTVVDTVLAVKHLLEQPFPRDIGSAHLSCMAVSPKNTDHEARALFPHAIHDFVRKAIASGTATENVDKEMVARTQKRADRIAELLSRVCARHEVLRSDLPLSHAVGCDRSLRVELDARPDEAVLQVAVYSPTPLSRTQVIVQGRDTPTVLKRQISDLSLDVRGLPPIKQSLRCICSQELRDTLTLVQQDIRDGDTICLEPLERCSCSVFHLSLIEYNFKKAKKVPSLKSLCRRAVLIRLWPHTEQVHELPIDDTLKRYLLSPSPSSGIVARPWFPPVQVATAATAIPAVVAVTAGVATTAATPAAGTAAAASTSATAAAATAATVAAQHAAATAAAHTAHPTAGVVTTAATTAATNPAAATAAAHTVAHAGAAGGSHATTSAYYANAATAAGNTAAGLTAATAALPHTTATAVHAVTAQQQQQQAAAAAAAAQAAAAQQAAAQAAAAQAATAQAVAAHTAAHAAHATHAATVAHK